MQQKTLNNTVGGESPMAISHFINFPVAAIPAPLRFMLSDE